jgi:hypothetical protein
VGVIRADGLSLPVLSSRLARVHDGFCGPLRRIRADVGAAPGDGEDEALVTKDVDRPQYGVAAYVMFLLELLHGGQGAVAPVALGDPRPEDGG